MHVYKLILSYSHSFIRSFIHLSLIHTPTEDFNQTSKSSYQVFTGNTQDKNEPAGSVIDPPIVARFIKIRVVTSKGHPALRAEFYGCTEGNLHRKIFRYFSIGFNSKTNSECRIKILYHIFWSYLQGFNENGNAVGR